MLVAILYLCERLTLSHQILGAGLCSLALTFKLTTVPLAIGCALILGSQWWLIKGKFKLRILILPLLILSGFIVRNIILSGWILFPFPIGNLHLPWSVPAPVVVETIEWIRGWAQSGPAYQPGSSRSLVGWIVPWIEQRRSEPEVFMLCIIVICLIASLVIHRLRWRVQSNRVRLLALGIAGTVYALSVAPDFRFAGFFIWILLVASFLLLLGNLRLTTSAFQFAILAFMILWLWKLNAILPRAEESGVSLTRLRRETSAEVNKVHTAEGFEYFVPVQGDQCGNAALPCAPRVVSVRLRNSGDISSGFLPGPRQ
ncbi:MAG: hypothetical protein JNM27_08740 [Leptospirales bacterium]|nr:hypothetical protein [Leptospirales bacterium]